MQFLPEPADLAAAVAALLDDAVLAAVPAELQHPVRVAAHLAHLLEREARLGPAAAAAERALLTDVLGAAHDDPAAALAARLAAGADGGGDAGDAGDAELERRAWAALVEITRRDLAVAKPGHDAWEGE